MARIRFRLLGGIFLISSATLCLEISLTRYFSISQQYHFAFWVVSIAFLGYGASGSFLALLKNLKSFDQNNFLSTTSLLFSMTILLSFLGCNAVPFDFINLAWNKDQIYLVLLYYFLLSVPFFFAGLTISFAIARLPVFVNKIYFSDLLGAGMGTLLSLFVFLPQGDRGVMILISLLALGASFLFSMNRSLIFRLSVFALAAAEAGLFICSPSWLSFRISPFKDLPVALKYPHAQLRFTKWNAISRIDVLESPAVRYAPGLSLLYQQPLPDQLGLTTDGGELTAITRFSDSHQNSLRFLSFLPSSLAYSFVNNPRTLIIDPKGGVDVLAAVAFHAPSIKIVESNPLIVNILHDHLASFSGHLYQRKNIQVTTAFNRAAIQKEKKKYDLIVFSLSGVFGSSSTGLYGFGENYLYTLDSFEQILNRMSPQGIVSMSFYLLPPPRQEIRILATWIEALKRRGINPVSHLAAIRSWGTISYFIKKSPFLEEDIQKLKNFVDKRLFDLVYYPGIKAEEANLHNRFQSPLYYDLTQKLLTSANRKDFYEDYLFDIRPVTDDSPFFYNFFKINKLKSTYKAFGRKWLPFLRGEFLVFLLLLQSVLTAFVLIVLPLLVSRKKSPGKKSLPQVFFYFGLIGLAFMFVEITFIQKFILFLGHPLYSVSVIIASLLISSGLGSLFSKKLLGQKLKRNLAGALFLCAGLIFVYLLLIPLFYQNFMGASLLPKIILTFSAVFPLGFLMGFPFPSGIRLLEQGKKQIIPWAWATNAFSSVVNSVSALMIAFWGGYNLVLMLAAGGYFLAVLFLGFSDHGHKTNP
ncbi:MAG: hypothetical protein ACLFVG_03465 [Candidatus Aminicenantes bacterium]